jgi:hypothetical protein
MKTLLLFGSLDNVQLERIELSQFPNPLYEFSGIPTICPDEFEAHELLSDQVEQNLGAVTILDVCCMDYHNEYQSKSVYEQMPLASINLLASVISMEPPFSVVLTDWLSMIAALGSASRLHEAPCLRRRESSPKFHHDAKWKHSDTQFPMVESHEATISRHNQYAADNECR